MGFLKLFVFHPRERSFLHFWERSGIEMLGRVCVQVQYLGFEKKTWLIREKKIWKIP